MLTEKRLVANQQNALLSTGPTTANGKLVVSTNAIKHGIFTRDLILSFGIGNESETDYNDLLGNLIDSLAPSNQMESLLVEKIAVDFWRLRRVLRYETGSLAESIKSLLKSFYSCGTKNNEELDKEIEYSQSVVAWNLNYIERLRQNQITIGEPEWKDEEFSTNLAEDFRLIAKTIPTLTRAEKDMVSDYSDTELDFESLRALLAKYGYSSGEEIAAKLIDYFTVDNQKLEREIQRISKKKIINSEADKLIFMLGMTPQTENTDKILKYERSLQKSIFQNLFMLKKLQQGQF